MCVWAFYAALSCSRHWHGGIEEVVKEADCRRGGTMGGWVWRGKKRDVVRMFPALLIFPQRWFCPCRIDATQQGSVRQEVGARFISFRAADI